MTRTWTLPPLAVFAVVVFVFAGELLSGTNLYFASMASLAIVCACVTYNILRGLGSISGIAFTRFALSTLVISQVGKVLVLERADQNLDTPNVVISVYALYFFSAMLGTMVFSRLRLPLPKPAEPETPTQSRYLYFVSLIGGLVGTALGFQALFRGEAGASSLAHGISLILGYLLPFSLVLAVDHRLRTTDGRHFFGWMAFWPTMVMELERISGGEPTGICRAVCHHLPHLLSAEFQVQEETSCRCDGVGCRILPLRVALLSVCAQRQGKSNVGRTSHYDDPNPGTGAIGVVDDQVPGWQPSGEQYLCSELFLEPGCGDSQPICFDRPGQHTDQCVRHRISLRIYLPQAGPVVPDSTSSLSQQADAGSAQFLGQLDGQEEGFEGATTFTTITTIADSYGSFGWLGVIVFAFFGLPAVFVVYESMFDMRKPWGTVATSICCSG
jgi:hypothetical protein